MTTIAFSPKLGPIKLDCYVSEKHTSTLEITNNPIESGANVNDHAYLNPKELELDIVDGDAAATYNALLAFQASRVPFTIVSGLTVNSNMLIKSITANRDKTHSKILSAKVELKEVIIVDTATSSMDAETVKLEKGKPGGTKSTNSSKPSKKLAKDTKTADRATSTTQQGDAAGVTASESEKKSVLRSLGESVGID